MRDTISARASPKWAISASLDDHPRLSLIAPAEGGFDPHRIEHMRAGDLARRTGRARGDGDPRQIERHDQTLRANAGNGEAKGVGEALRGFAENDGVGGDIADMRANAVPQFCEPGRLVGHFRPDRPRGRAKSGDPRDIFRAGARAPLLPAATQQGLGHDDIGRGGDERADAFRAAKLMGGEN